MSRLASNRSGVAIFAVLGTVVLVTALGFVGMELAQKDQVLAGDIQDIKSRDLALDGAFQLAANRLMRSPANLATQLNNFVDDQQKGVSNPRVWIDFSGTDPVLVAAKPSDPVRLSATDAKTSARVRVLAVHIDGTQDDNKVYLSLQAFAQGRHGDQKAGVAVYRLDGMGQLFNQVNVTYNPPNVPAYFGPNMAASDLQLTVNGGLFIAGTNPGTNTGLNSSAGLTINGPFRWGGPDPLVINGTNAGAKVVVNGPAYIRGGIHFNASNAVIEFNGNTAIVANSSGYGGIFNMPGNDRITVNGNLWIGGVPNPAWQTGINNGTPRSSITLPNPAGLANYGNLYIENIAANRPGWQSEIPLGLDVGGSLWLQRANTGRPLSGPLSVKGDMILGPDPATSPFDFSTSGGFSVGGIVLHRDNTMRVIGPAGSVNNVLGSYLGGTLWARNGAIVKIAGNAGGAASPDGVSTLIAGTSSPMPAPTVVAPAFNDVQFGVPLVMAQASPATYPPPQATVETSPTATAKMVDLSTLTGNTGNNNLSACDMNGLYQNNKNLLANGYLVVHVNTPVTITTCGSAGVTGKFMWVIDKVVGVNSIWPVSNSSSDIQVIQVRGEKGGELVQWGFQAGTFYGMVYWSDPKTSTSPITMKWGTPAPSLQGALILDQSIAQPATYINIGASAVNISLNQAVFDDIQLSMPGVLHQNAPTGSSPPYEETRVTATATSSLPVAGKVRAVTDQVWFAPVSMYH